MSSDRRQQYQYLLGKVSTEQRDFGTELCKVVYQYLLGKVSTDDEKEEYYRFMYQYLLGKVSTYARCHRRVLI